jgi:hypothetical protein
MRCPDCQKFVSLETQIEDPNPDVEFEFHAERLIANGTVHVSRMCGECGQELKAADIEFEVDLEVTELLTLSEEQRDEIAVTIEVSETEGGGGRYKKNMVGFSGTLTAALGERVLVTYEVAEAVAASEFEEVV